MTTKAFNHGKLGSSFLAHFEAQNDLHPMAVLSDKSAALWLSTFHQNQASKHPLSDSIETWTTKNHHLYYCTGARMVVFFTHVFKVRGTSLPLP